MTLVEVLVSAALFALVSVGAAHLLVWSVRALWSTGAETIARAAAQTKMEELHALAWRFDAAGARLSDLETDLAAAAPAAGGRGLSPSPPGTLVENVGGYADYLDDRGVRVGTDTQPPAGAAFVRRWAVRPLATSPDDTLVLQVLVVPLAIEAPADRVASGRTPGSCLLVTARTRVR